ncbi:hypothetical protein SLS60_000917 [Paraconiothyrium brasiliense]|uniref:Uncharacterized protein n=1 Tax=Paraconiothyrium brasiliense TaxID=300254 RepID=A0ABR3S8D9_9PLEO
MQTVTKGKGEEKPGSLASQHDLVVGSSHCEKNEQEETEHASSNVAAAACSKSEESEAKAGTQASDNATIAECLYFKESEHKKTAQNPDNVTAAEPSRSTQSKQEEAGQNTKPVTSAGSSKDMTEPELIHKPVKQSLNWPEGLSEEYIYELERLSLQYFSRKPKKNPRVALEPNQLARTVYPNVNTVYDAGLFKPILEAETRAGRIEATKDAAMVSEVEQDSDELQQQTLGQFDRQCRLCSQVKIMRRDMETRTSRLPCDGSRSDQIQP